MESVDKDTVDIYIKKDPHHDGFTGSWTDSAKLGVFTDIFAISSLRDLFSSNSFHPLGLQKQETVWTTTDDDEFRSVLPHLKIAIRIDAAPYIRVHSRRIPG